ncbi:MAG: outer membrane lipoprotein carrier protein LolA [Reichenbachiella sp.]
MRLVLIILMLLPLIGVAQENELARFVSLLSTKNASLQSLESDFSQVQSFSFLDEVLKSSGKFYFKKPGSLKWDQTSPEAYAFVITPVAAYSFDGKQKKSMPANSPQLVGFKKFIMGTIDGSVFVGDDFKNEVTFINGTVKVVMLPQKKALKKIFERVEMEFDEQTLYLKELKFFESEEDIRTMTFTDQEINTLTNSTLFD